VNKIPENEKNNMQPTSTIAKVFDTVLSIPGMNDNVKIQLTIPRIYFWCPMKCFISLVIGLRLVPILFKRQI
jgi:hypothetical protein